MTTPRICIATTLYGGPSTGTVHYKYMQCVMQLHGRAKFLTTTVLGNCDLVRARSRAVRVALDGCFTHLLFWDSDVIGDAARCLEGMLEQDKELIAAAYPRKHLPPEPTHKLPYVGMGFTLIRTSLLERMWDRYHDELQFEDVIEGKASRSVALFQLVFAQKDVPQRPGRALLSEDYSFCERAMACGADVHLYDGPGSPLSHIGGFVFQGTREELVHE